MILLALLLILFCFVADTFPCYFALPEITDVYLFIKLKASILKMYPAEIMLVAIYCLFVTIQSSAVTLIAERDLNAWRLETKIGFIAVLFSVSK